MRKTRTRLTALGLALALLLTSCGGGASAATMHLRKTEGTVAVSDSEGKDVAPRENLGLYSGYQVGTQAESYAWIDLDKVKLTKLDADSEIEIVKDGKKLEIDVKSGSLFFNVTQPLAGDETMDIRTSSMVVGIRGTCGWVTEDTAALLEGTVSVTAGDQEVTISAGEMAALTAEGTLEVKPLTAASVPAFVREEIADDEDLATNIQDTTGMDLTGEDPLALYAGQLDSTFEEVLYTEFVDFEGDGRPELLAIGITKVELSPPYSDRAARLCVFTDDPEEHQHYDACVMHLMLEDGNYQKEMNWLLAEADGRLFIKEYLYIGPQDASPYPQEYYWYWGFNDEGNWFRERVERSEDVRGYRYTYRSDSQVYREIDAGEYAAIPAKYSDVKLLAHSSNETTLEIDAS